MTASEDGKISIRVHPDRQRIVQPRDHEYLEALFADFKERAALDPEALFQQLSSLSVGPIITRVTGLNLMDHPAFLDLFDQFQDA